MTADRATLLAMPPAERMQRLAEAAFQTRAARAASAGAIGPQARSVGQRGGTKAADALPFPRLCELAGLPVPLAELRFHPVRRWRFDYAWPDYRLALEVEGGGRDGGRHTRPMGFLADMAKYNEATRRGWRLLRCTPGTLATDATLKLVRESLDP